MALATFIEMGLLGITFSIGIKSTATQKWLHFCIVLIPPVCLAGAAYVGGLLGTTLETSPMLFLAMISFGVVALLFLVTQELLIKAHENQDGEELWWINMWLFFGVMLGVLVDVD